MKIKLSQVIIVIGLLLFSYIVFPLFKEGYPINIDSAPQYLRLHCLSQSNLLLFPNNYCTLINAGVPTSQYYYPLDLLIVLFGYTIGLLFAYKLTLVFAIIVPAIGIWVWLKNKYPLGAAFAFVFYLLYTAGWHGSGFQETILVGFWHYMLSVGFLFIALYHYNRYMSGNFDSIVWAVFFVPFFLHPMTIIAAVIGYITITCCNLSYLDKDKWDFIAGVIFFLALALCITAFYWIPLTFKLQYFPQSIGGMLDVSLFNAYIFSPIPILMLILAGFGIYRAIINKEWPILSLFGSFVIFAGLSFFKIPILSRFFIGVRIGAFLGPLVIMLAGLYLGQASLTISSKSKLSKYNNIFKIGSIIVAIIMIAILFVKINEERSGILLSTPQDEQFYKMLDASLGPGRILMEDTLYTMGMTKNSMTHMDSLLPILTGREMIGFCPIIFPKNMNLLDNTGPSLFNTNIDEWDFNNLTEIFNWYNIKYLLIHSENYINYFDKHLNGASIFGVYKLYDTGIDPSYVIGAQSSKYAKTEAYAFVNNATTIKLKMNYYPNWVAYQNNTPLDIYECDGIICVNSTGPGEIDFEYAETWPDAVGFLVSIITFGIIFMILLGTGAQI